MRHLTITIMLLVLIALAVAPATANSVTMSNPGGIAERDVLVYYGNGTLAGQYNTTSTITLNSDLDYIFALRPTTSNPLDDPTDWIENTAFPWVQSNFVALIALAFLVFLAFSRRT